MLCFCCYGGRLLAWRSVRLSIQRQATGVVAQPVQRGTGQQGIAWKGLIPLGKVQVAGDDGGRMPGASSMTCSWPTRARPAG